MTRTVFCIALVLLLMVPMVPWSASENETSQDLEWEHLEKFEQHPHNITVRIVDSDDPVNGRYDRLLIDVKLDNPVETPFIVFSTLSSREGRASTGRIERIHTLSEGEGKLTLVYNGTELYLGAFTFPYLLEFSFKSEKEEGGQSSFLIHGDFSHLRYESPFPAGFNEKITYVGLADDDTGEFSDLEVTLSMFTKLRGNYTIVAKLHAEGDDFPVADIPRILSPEYVKYGVKDSEPKIEEGKGTEADLQEEGSRGAVDGSTGTETGGGRSVSGDTPDHRSVTPANKSATFTPLPIKPMGGQLVESIILPLTVEKSGELIHELTMTFSGPRIHASFWDGPFLLTVSIYHRGAFIESVDWVIKDIPYSDFTPGKPLGTFTKEYNVKETGTGLDLTVMVLITEPDTFTIAGEAYSDSIIEKSLEKINEKINERYIDGIQGINTNTDGDDAGSDPERFPDGIPRFSVTRKLDRGSTSVTLTFDEVFQREELFIFLSITSMSTGGSDFLEIHLDPKDPEPDGLIIIEDHHLWDAGEDPDDDSRFDYLLLEGTPELPVGSYELEARLMADHLGYSHVISIIRDSVHVGSASSPGGVPTASLASIKIRFPGEDIFLSDTDGPYAVLIYLTAENGITYVMKYQTGAYRSIQFSPFGGRKDTGTEPEFSFTNEAIFLHTDVFASEVLRDTPELVYYYYTDMGESIKFRVRYTRLIAYQDDGDGILEAGEGKYEAVLSTRSWTTSPVRHGLDSRLGSYLSFSMSTTISLQAMGGADSASGDEHTDGTNGTSGDGDDGNRTVRFIPNWATLRLHFLISNNTVDEPDLMIKGGEELKITVEITPNTDLDARVNAVALEQKILLEENGRIVTGATGDEAGRVGNEASGTWTSVDTQENCGNDSISRLSYLGPDGDVLGYYSWACTAEQILSNGSKLAVTVGSHSREVNGTIVLYLSYPISNDVESLVHDPSVGVIRENAPIITVSILTDTLEANPWSYLTGLIMATIIVVITLTTGRTSRKGQDRKDHDRTEQGRNGRGTAGTGSGTLDHHTDGNESIEEGHRGGDGRGIDPGENDPPVVSGNERDQWKPAGSPFAPQPEGEEEENGMIPELSIRPQDLMPTNNGHGDGFME